MTQIDELLLTHSQSVPIDDAIEREALDQARRVLRATVADEQPRRQHGRARRRMGRFALIAGLAVTVAVVVALLPGRTRNDVGHLGPLGPLGPAPASARVALLRAASQLEHRAWRPLRPGEYFYYRYEQRFPYQNGPNAAATARARRVMIQDSWIGANGFARFVQRGDEVLLFHPSPQQIQAERELQTHGSHLQVLAYSQPYHWVDLDYQQLIHLPTHPAALRRWIERHAIGSGSHDDKVVNYTGALLQQAPPLPPKLTAAFYRVLARLPEMRLVGPTRDPLGRPGIAVAFLGGHGGQWEMLFNPNTGALLANRYTSLNGTVVGWETIANQAIVHSDQQLPTSNS